MPRERFLVLDSWRGICAVLVAVFHMTVLSHLFYNPFIRNAWLFVDFFFVLSGFVITHAYRTRLGSADELLSFAIRRFGRLWPLQMAMLALFVCSELGKLAIANAHGIGVEQAPFTGRRSLPALAANVLLAQALPVVGAMSWNVPSWSISAEWWVYLLFGGTLVLTGHRAGAGRPRSAAALALLLAAALGVLWAGGARLDVPVGLEIPRCLFGFVTGCFVHGLVRRSPGPRAGATGLELVALAAVALFVSHAAGSPAELLAPLVFGGAVWLFAFERGLVSRLLSARPFVWMGKLSFALYMVHWFVREMFGRGLTVVAHRLGVPLATPIPPELSKWLGSTQMISWGGVWGGDLVLLAYVAISLAVAAGLHGAVERPGQRWFARLADGVLGANERRRARRAPLDPEPL